MPKAKTIDRLEYTRGRSVHLQEDTPKYEAAVPIRKAEGYFDSSSGMFEAHDVPSVEICPMCGAEVIQRQDVCGASVDGRGAECERRCQKL